MKSIGYGKVSVRNEVINWLKILLVIGSFTSFLLDYFHFRVVKRVIMDFGEKKRLLGTGTGILQSLSHSYPVIHSTPFDHLSTDFEASKQ